MKELVQAGKLYSVYLWWTSSLQLAHRIKGEAYLIPYLRSLRTKKWVCTRKGVYFDAGPVCRDSRCNSSTHACWRAEDCVAMPQHELMIANSSIWAAMAIANNDALIGWFVVPHPVAGVMLLTQFCFLCAAGLSAVRCEENMFTHDMNAPCIRHWLICKLNTKPAWTRQTP